ncbi:hypothetical protein [Acinetobacter sp. MD2(2019)]|uniref:hypothetical protein n=1 Tax=Acinetobacter sp. MD2(2019) TaxID=2605273 RepID=UPI002D1F3C09|nr:hypothetical protein [Acinetobacter sp. MD2(2019)]MEB3754226.1 hypothetical protein [Acinetobacter sp. MD2(2019)]
MKYIEYIEDISNEIYLESQPFDALWHYLELGEHSFYKEELKEFEFRKLVFFNI